MDVTVCVAAFGALSSGQYTVRIHRRKDIRSIEQYCNCCIHETQIFD